MSPHVKGLLQYSQMSQSGILSLVMRKPASRIMRPARGLMSAMAISADSVLNATQRKSASSAVPMSSCSSRKKKKRSAEGEKLLSQ